MDQGMTSGSVSHLPLVYGLLSAIFFGSCAPATKYFLGSCGPVSLAALFYLGSGTGMLILLIASLVFRQGSPGHEPPLTRTDIPYLAGMIFFGGILAPVILMYSMIQTPAATGSLLLNFEPVATVVLAALFFHEAVGRRIWAAMILITGSCIMLSLNTGSEFGFSFGAIGVLICCIFWALDNNISRYVSGRDPLSAILFKGLGAGIISLGIAVSIGEQLPPLFQIPIFLVVGFFSFGGLASVFFLLALRSLGTARAGLLLALSPFFGVFFSVILFREPLQSGFLIAAPIMVVGTWLLVTERHAHEHQHVALVHNHRHRHADLHHIHQHPEGTPPQSRSGEHTHLHSHQVITHDHPHKPDLHHRHDHMNK